MANIIASNVKAIYTGGGVTQVQITKSYLHLILTLKGSRSVDKDILHLATNNRKLVIVLAVVLSCILGYITTKNVKSAADQVDTNIQSLLQRLDNEISVRVSEHKEFSFQILFAKSLNGVDIMWTLGTQPDTNQKHEISEIGTDYVCFKTFLEGVTSEDCTPFTNIVNISYLHS